MIVVMLAAVVGILALIACIVLEERGRPHVAVIAVLLVVVVDALVYPDQGAVPTGPFRVALGGQEIRVADAVILVALVARLLVRGLPRRVTGEGLIWLAFFGLFGFELFMGFANHHDSTLVIFQTKFILEAGGMAVLVAGVPAAIWTRRQMVIRAAWTIGLLSIVPIAVGAAGLDASVPLLAGSSLKFSADAATLLVSIGVLLLMIEVCSEQPRPVVIGWCSLFIISPVVAAQRAAVIGMAAALVCLVVLMAGRVWHERSAVRLSHLLPLVALLVIPLGVMAIQGARTGSLATDYPLKSSIDKTFLATGKQQSADIRLVVWRQGRDLALERPVLGWGLGQDFNIYQNNGSEDPFTGGDYHNIAIDIAVTTGLTGLGLLIVAVCTSLWSAYATWHRASRSAIAALAAGSAIVMMELCTKGMFESIFQKFRLGILFGFAIGAILGVRVRPSTE